MKCCLDADVRNVKYLRAVLTDWKESGILSVDQVKSREAEHIHRKRTKRNKGPGDKQQSVKTESSKYEKTTILANVSNKNWYWVAGLCMYIFSFLASWSIGGYTLSVVFALWALAIGYSLKLIKKFYHAIIAVVVGLAVWFVMINTLDDVWWFLPF